MDVEGPLSKAFAIFAISFFGVAYVLAIIGLIIASADGFVHLFKGIVSLS